MKDSIRTDLKKLCYHIIENKEPEALAEQLTQVQMLYERLLVINYLNEQSLEPNTTASAAPKGAIAAAEEGKHLKSDTDLTSKENTAFPQKIEAPKKVKPVDLPAEIVPSADENIFEIDAFIPSAHEAKSEKEAKKTTPPTSEVTPATGPKAEEKEKAEETLEKNAALEKETKAETKVPASPKRASEAATQEEFSKPAASINDRLAQGNIEIGLNDRIAFVNHLFQGGQEDFNRVLSQLNTFGTVKEANDFLTEVVKPDYNWVNKSDYVDRLLGLVRKKLGEAPTE
jgi:hypothetical protein